MTPLFTARRKAKRPAPQTPRDKSPPDSTNLDDKDDESPVVVRKPLAGLKKSSKLRTSQLSTPTTQTPQPRSINGTPEPDSRSTQQSSTTPVQKSNSLTTQPSSSQIPIPNLSIDIASKFGPSATTSTSTAIPTSAQIAERKARRARLAKESQAALLSGNDTTGENSITKNSDFISLDAYDSDGEFKPSRLQVSTYLHEDKLSADKEFTRLVPEDEHGEIAEGFESFVDPEDHQTANGRIHTSSLNAKATRLKERDTMRALIERAEGHSIRSHSSGEEDGNGDSDSNAGSDSDASLNAAYTSAQTAHGVSMSHLSQQQRRQLNRDAIRPRAPEKTTSIPSVAAGLEKLRGLQVQAEAGKRSAEVRIADIQRRLGEIEGEKERIQKGLEEIGAQLEAVGVGIDGQAEKIGENGGLSDDPRKGRGRGLDDIGG